MKKYDKKYNRSIKLVDYNEKWPEVFSAEKKNLEKIFENIEGEALHMGSTAIVGMFAKPEIDIVVRTISIDEVPDYYAEMERHGYSPKGDYTHINEEYFTKDVDGERKFNVHVMQKENPEIEPIFRFIKHMQLHPEDVMKYKELKTMLFEKYPDDYSMYKKGKNDFIKSILNNL